ncbi:MAG: GNAT family N-acetyltransferase [Proteobacteria bacterium]|nr:GNAT family N-acetyltransferase [Pseudomonadota bacterium]
MIRVTRAGRLHLGGMADLLNAVIAKGGTTAFVEAVTRDDLASWMERAPERSAWHVAEDDAGRVKGFQWIAPHDGLPDDTCDIATFVAPDTQGLGVGSALFPATRDAARDLGYAFIAAVIRQDNTGGLAYYQSHGFEDWRRWNDAPVAPRIIKRYSL